MKLALAVIKARLQVERDNLRADAMELKQKLDDQNHNRNELDDELCRLRKDVDDATMVRVDLERKIETLTEEVAIAKQMHREDQATAKKQIEEQGLSIEVDGVPADYSEILRQIRAQYHRISSNNENNSDIIFDFW